MCVFLSLGIFLQFRLSSFFLVFLSVCGSFYLNVSHFLIIGFFIVCPLSERGWSKIDLSMGGVEL